MEGLEISVLELSKLNEIETFRFDSDYFLKKYIYQNEIINCKIEYFPKLIDLGLKIDASAFYPSLEPYYNTGTLPFIRVQNVDDFIDYQNCVTIPESVVNSDAFSTLNIINKGDIVITKGGSIGRVALIDRPTAVTRDLIYINSSKMNRRDYVFLYIYLTTKFSFDLMVQSSSMTAQPHLTLTLVKNIPVFNPSENFKKAIFDIYEQLLDNRNLSQQKYAEAERLLLETLGLQDFHPSAEAVNIKSFKDSFVTTGRLDAEYYQPKYEETVNRIKQNDWKLLNQIVNISKSIEPGSSAYDEEKGLPFYRVSDYNKFGLNIPAKNLSLSYVNENKDLLKDLKPKTGTILFSKDGSVGTAYLLTEDLKGITSGATLHLKVKEEVNVLPEYLTLALNSKLVQLQAERDAGGSIILHWRLDEIENVVVPIVDFSIQQRIARLIKESFSLKAESENLLEVAKKAVEIAIEEDEEMALEFINKNIR